MSCSPHDLRDYLLQELGGAERREVERHAASCGACRLELDRLRMTEAALASLRDEEIPRRIAFVSDKIFEPSLLHRWWRAGWAPAGVLIAAAIVFSALYRAPQPAPAVVPMTLNAAQLRSEISRELAKVVAASEDRQARRTAELLAAAEKRYELDRQADRLAVQETFEVMRKRLNVMYLASSDIREAK